MKRVLGHDFAKLETGGVIGARMRKSIFFSASNGTLGVCV